VSVRVLKTVILNGVNPISTNKLHRMQWSRNAVRVKRSNAYAAWRRALLAILPDDFLPKDMSGYSLLFEMGIAKGFDLDNALKGIIDVLEEKYGFSDSQIGHLIAHKCVIDPVAEQRFIKIQLVEKLELDERGALLIDASDDVVSTELEALREVITG
jgi:Holliday junction resolvase RusA-like endonuclease